MVPLPRLERGPPDPQAGYWPEFLARVRPARRRLPSQGARPRLGHRRMAALCCGWRLARASYRGTLRRRPGEQQFQPPL